jgi:hypothetical protein
MSEILLKMWVYIGLRLKYLLLRSDFNEISISRQSFEKYLNIKFHENPSSVIRVVSCGQTDRRTDRRDDANSRFVQFFERA